MKDEPQALGQVQSHSPWELSQFGLYTSMPHTHPGESRPNLSGTTWKTKHEAGETPDEIPACGVGMSTRR